MATNDSDSAIGQELGSLIEHSHPSDRLPAALRRTLGSIPSHTLERIRIHNDPAAHSAAKGLEARAFTIGPSIYFAQGEYQPATRRGLHVLAHEAAHAHQQANADLPAAAQLRVSSPSSREEIDADRFAQALVSGVAPATPTPMTGGQVARVMRVSFDVTGIPQVVDIKERKDRSAAGFSFGGGGGRPMEIEGITIPAQLFLFNWAPAVTIHGAPEEVTHRWQVGMLQRMRSYRLDIWWGPSLTHLGGTAAAVRDAKCQTIPWFDKTKQSPPFIGDGDTQSATIEDSPWVQIPFKNPETGLVETLIKFDFSATFITYLSARRIPGEFVEESFNHLKSVRWRVNAKGRYDAKEPAPAIIFESGTTKLEGEVIEASSEKERPILGGTTGLEEMNRIQKQWEPDLKPLDTC